MSRVLSGILIALGGGAVAAGGYFAYRSKKTGDATEQAILTGGAINLRLTGYWPFTAREDEKKMEGAPVDRKGKPLHTVEDFLDGKADFVSLSGDDAVWPYGQKILIPWTDGKTIVGRVVDTGRNFRGSTKVYRAVGHEPIDVCVYSSKTVVPKLVVGHIVKGDNFEGGKMVATKGIKDQDVVVGFSDGDREALARAIESSCSRGTLAEKQVVAWACRNRAARLGVPIAKMLAPEDAYGPRGSGGRDFASTEKTPGDISMKVARAVLTLPTSSDPTRGAIDFWNPKQQARLKILGDAHRAAVACGDAGRAASLAPFAAYEAGEEEMRVVLGACGLKVCCVVGEVELLCA